MRSTILPVVVSRFGKAGHRFLHVLLCNLALRFAHKVDDALVGFQVLVPRRGCLPAGRDSHTHERKERHEKSATLLDDKRVARKFAEAKVEMKIMFPRLPRVAYYPPRIESSRGRGALVPPGEPPILPGFRGVHRVVQHPSRSGGQLAHFALTLS